jgi:hypothetical protein
MAGLDGMTITFKGVDAFERACEQLFVKVMRGAENATREGAEVLRSSIQSHMHGRPGPNYITGNLYDSIKVQATGGGVGLGRWNYGVYADMAQAPYARRIELGFTGTDSIGRGYNQPPYPYFGPGVNDAISGGDVYEVFYRDFAEVIRL